MLKLYEFCLPESVEMRAIYVQVTSSKCHLLKGNANKRFFQTSHLLLQIISLAGNAYLLMSVCKVKVKFCRYRPKQALGDPVGLGS